VSQRNAYSRIVLTKIKLRFETTNLKLAAPLWFSECLLYELLCLKGEKLKDSAKRLLENSMEGLCLLMPEKKLTQGRISLRHLVFAFTSCCIEGSLYIFFLKVLC
jgi:hypothetical protein